jgi:hypothetical protein
MSTLLVITLYFLTTLKAMPKIEKEKMNASIEKRKDIEERESFKEHIDSIIKDLESTGNYEVVGYIGSGAKGIVLKGNYLKESHGEPKERAIKVSYNGQADEIITEDELKYLNSQNSTSVIKLFEEFVIEKFSRKLQRNIYYTIDVLELGYQSLEKELFSGKKMEVNKKRNAEVLADLFLKIIDAFNDFNFVHNYVHGDIKPANLVVFKESTGLYNVRIIDLDFSFQINMGEKIHPFSVLYSLNYRPPEMKEICPTNMCEGDFKSDKPLFDRLKKTYQELKIDIQRIDFICEHYVMNELFKEDAYAVGKTLSDILNLNIDMVDSSNPTLVYAQNTLIPNLMKANPKERIHLLKASVDFRKNQSPMLKSSKVSRKYSDCISTSSCSSDEKVRNIAII